MSNNNWVSNLNINKDDIVIIHQNIRSVRKNFDVFLLELNSNSFYPDVIILSEIWINSNESNLYNIPHYSQFIKCNNGYRSGGIVVYLHESLEKIDCCLLNFQTADIIKVAIKKN